MSFEGMGRILCTCGRDYEYPCYSVNTDPKQCPDCHHCEPVCRMVYDYTNGTKAEQDENHRMEKKFERAKTCYYKKHQNIQLQVLIRQQQELSDKIRVLSKDLEDICKEIFKLTLKINKPIKKRA